MFSQACKAVLVEFLHVVDCMLSELSGALISCLGADLELVF